MRRFWVGVTVGAVVAVAGGVWAKKKPVKPVEVGVIEVVGVNRPPELELPPYAQVPPGKEIAFGLHAIDQDGDQLAIELVAKPASAAYDPLTLTVRWKPTAKDKPAGHFRVRLTETQRVGGQRRVYLHDFAIAVVPGAKPVTVAQPLGPAVEQLITIHDPERLAQVNKDWPITKMLEAVRTIELKKLSDEERNKVVAPDGKALYLDAMTAIALRSGNPRANPQDKAFDKKAFGDPKAWKITAVRPRIDKAAQELRVVYENVRAPEPVYLMFRFRLVRDLPPGQLAPEALALNNKEFTRLAYEHFFTGKALNPKHTTDKKAHGKAVSSFVTAVLTYQSDAHPQLGAEFIALPHEARFGGGTLRKADGSYDSGDGWYWAVLKQKWEDVKGQKTLRIVSVPIPGFTTEIAPSDDRTKWKTVCGRDWDPDDKRHKPGWEVLCRKAMGFTDLPARGEGGKIVPGAIDATNLYGDHKYKDMVQTVPLRDPRRDNFEENGMTCSQCHVRDFANGDLREPGIRDPKAAAPNPSPQISTNFFNLVPEEEWKSFMLEFQRFQECLFKDAFKKHLGVDVDLVCPQRAE